MERKHNEHLVPLARKLRKDMTKEERRLWYDYLRDYPVRFYRQKILGHYIADFYCAKARLVVELDGSQHYEIEGQAYDEERSACFQKFGIAVLRFSNLDVLRNLEGVCAAIDVAVNNRMGNCVGDNPSVACGASSPYTGEPSMKTVQLYTDGEPGCAGSLIEIRPARR